MDPRRRYKIGELAQRSGLPVKTVRYYSDLGVLPPSGVTGSGHRWYTEQDHIRLEAIRSLREVGLGLDQIMQVLQNETSVTETLELQLQMVELEIRQLERRQVLLRRALQQQDHLDYLKGARTLALLNAQERQRVLSQQINRLLEGVPADPDWMEDLWRGPWLQLPDEFTPQQYGAWLELAELVLDPDFIGRFNQMGKEFWGQFESPEAREQHLVRQQVWDRQIAQAHLEGTSPESEAGQRIIAALLRLGDPEGSPEDLRKQAQEQLNLIEQNTDHRALRFWQLVEQVQGTPGRCEKVMALHGWKVQALTCFVNRATHSLRR